MNEASMNVKKTSPTLPFDLLFLKGSEAFGEDGYRVLGALLAKQSVAFDGGGSQQPPLAEAIRLKDLDYAATDQRANPPSPNPADPVVKVKLEADVTVYKHHLDVVAVSPFSNKETFGTFTVTRTGNALSSAAVGYGWLERIANARKALAGAAGAYAPVEDEPFKLPVDFDDHFFNGSPAGAFGGLALSAGHTVRFQGSVIRPSDTVAIDLTVTIPPGPTLTFTQNCWAVPPPQWVSRGVDTVVLLAGERRVLLTWRFVFVWEQRLSLATLEVS